MKSNLVIIGMPTAGKTTLSTLLAKETGHRLISMDKELEREMKMSIADCFQRYGEGYFRDRESDLAARAGKEEGCVIDCGGGIILREENMQALQENGTIIWIDRPLEFLFPSTDRPLSRDPEAVAELYEHRQPYYRKWADIIIHNDRTIEEALQDILTIMENSK